jgi:hypothetical protein
MVITIVFQKEGLHGSYFNLLPAAARYFPFYCCRFFAPLGEKSATKDNNYRSIEG